MLGNVFLLGALDKEGKAEGDEVRTAKEWL